MGEIRLVGNIYVLDQGDRSGKCRNGGTGNTFYIFLPDVGPYFLAKVHYCRVFDVSRPISMHLMVMAAPQDGQDLALVALFEMAIGCTFHFDMFQVLHEGVAGCYSPIGCNVA